MKKNKKLAILSILTSAVIMTSSIPVNRTTNGYISRFYDVLMDDITTDYSLLDEKYNIVPDNNYVPQGIALVNGYVITSSFDYYKENNSILNIYDQEGNLFNVCTLEHKAHVGGIAYDKVNELLWVTAFDGNVSAYNISDVFNKNKVEAIYSNLNVGHGLTNYVYPWMNSASFVTIYNNELYVGNFSLSGDGKVKKFSINNKDGNVKLQYVSQFKIPDMVQGITFYSKNGKEFILFSRSYGRDCSSILQIFKYDQKVKDYGDSKLSNVTLKMPPMLEQIVCDDNKLYALYESNAKPYVYIQSQDFDSISTIDANELVKKLELKIDTN